MSYSLSDDNVYTFIRNRYDSPGQGNVYVGNDPGIYGGIVSDTFFAAVGRNKRRVARRLKFLINEQALRTRAVD